MMQAKVMYSGGKRAHRGVCMGVVHKRLVEVPGLPQLLGAQLRDYPVEDPGEVTGEAKQLGSDVDTLAKARRDDFNYIRKNSGKQ